MGGWLFWVGYGVLFGLSGLKVDVECYLIADCGQGIVNPKVRAFERTRGGEADCFCLREGINAAFVKGYVEVNRARLPQHCQVTSDDACVFACNLDFSPC